MRLYLSVKIGFNRSHFTINSLLNKNKLVLGLDVFKMKALYYSLNDSENDFLNINIKK